jgi:formyltetrahydrofolate synthetase
MFITISLIKVNKRNINNIIDTSYSILSKENKFFYDYKSMINEHINICNASIYGANKNDYTREIKRLNDLQTELLLKEIVEC